MRVDNLLCLRKQAFVHANDSDHALRIYPNLARELKPSGLNQLWCRYYLHSLARIRVSGSDSGCVFTPGDWVGVGPHVRGEVGLEALQIAIGRGRVMPGLGSRGAVRVNGLHRIAYYTRHSDQHEPARQPLRQRTGGIVLSRR